MFNNLGNNMTFQGPTLARTTSGVPVDPADCAVATGTINNKNRNEKHVPAQRVFRNIDASSTSTWPITASV
jgi:hypothetical protein